MLHIQGGGTPTKPTGDDLIFCVARGLTDSVWSLMSSCWDRSPGKRPRARDILSSMKNLEDSRPDEPNSRSSLRYRRGVDFSANSALRVTAANFIEKVCTQFERLTSYLLTLRCLQALYRNLMNFTPIIARRLLACMCVPPSLGQSNDENICPANEAQFWSQ